MEPFLQIKPLVPNNVIVNLVTNNTHCNSGLLKSFNVSLYKNIFIKCNARDANS